jgi:hypothetical protein
MYNCRNEIIEVFHRLHVVEFLLYRKHMLSCEVILPHRYSWFTLRKDETWARKAKYISQVFARNGIVCWSSVSIDGARWIALRQQLLLYLLHDNRVTMVKGCCVNDGFESRQMSANIGGELRDTIWVYCLLNSER